MSITEVRTRFHALIDEVENPAMLQRFFEVMKVSAKSPDADLWGSLTKEEQQEVIAAYDESLDEKNLVSNKTVMAKYARFDNF